MFINILNISILCQPNEMIDIQTMIVGLKVIIVPFPDIRIL